MRETFVTLFILYFIAEVFVIVLLRLKKKATEAKTVSQSFVLFSLLVLSVYLFHLVFPYYALILTTAVLLIHSILGFHFEFYNKFQTFDHYLHAFGTFSFALLIYHLLSNFLIFGGSLTVRALFIFFLGIGLGALFEVSEYVFDFKNRSHMQQGLKDTNNDLIWDIVGALCAAVFGYFVIL